MTEYEEDAEVDVAAEDDKAEAEDEAEDVALLLPFVPLLRDEAEFTAKLSSSFWPIKPPLNWVSLGSFLRASVTASGQRQLCSQELCFEQGPREAKACADQVSLDTRAGCTKALRRGSRQNPRQRGRRLDESHE